MPGTPGQQQNYMDIGMYGAFCSVNSHFIIGIYIWGGGNPLALYSAPVSLGVAIRVEFFNVYEILSTS